MQSEREKKQTATGQGKEPVMKKVINMVKRILAAMGCAYKEAAPYMNICHYDCQTVQIVY